MHIYSGADRFQIDQKIFSGGEVHVQLPLELENRKRAKIVARVMNNDSLMQVVMAINALANLRVGHIEVRLPYFPYARQDRVCAKGQADARSVVYDMLKSAGGATSKVSIVAYDLRSPHPGIIDLDQWAMLSRHETLVRWIDEHNPLLICPDKGAEKKCDRIMRHTCLFDRMVVADKVRNPETGWIESCSLDDHAVSGYHCLIVDDICDGGMTFKLLAAKLKELGAKSVALYVTHGLWSKGIHSMREHIDGFYTTNTIIQDRLNPEFVYNIIED